MDINQNKKELFIESDAWLEFNNEKIYLTNPFKLGRSTRCSHVIADNKISREHTLIQYNSLDKCWVVIDLNSRNGTYLNGLRILQQMKIKSGDQIRVGCNEYYFFNTGEEGTGDSLDQNSSIDKTAIHITTHNYWLLLADVKDSTKLALELPHPVWSKKVHTWVEEVETIVNRHCGIVNDYRGDGLLAFWNDDKEANIHVAKSLKALNSLESKSGLLFRVILHYGEVIKGGAVTSGREKFSGPEIKFIDNIEKVAGATGAKITLTNCSTMKLKSILNFQLLGEYEVSGFNGKHPLFFPQFDDV